MTVNSIKIKLIIIGICCLIGFGPMTISGSVPKTGDLISYEEDDRVCDTNYLDMPAAESGENGGYNILFYIVIFVLMAAGGLILLRFELNLKKY